MRKTIFIGSSTESLSEAEKIAAWLESFNITPVVWNTVFEPGEYTLDSLERTLKSVSGAIFIFNADDINISRGVRATSVRDNVLFEFGYFAGGLSRDRVIFVCSEKPKLPSDFFGLTYLTITDNNEYTTKPRLRKWAEKLPFPNSNNTDTATYANPNTITSPIANPNIITSPMANPNIGTPPIANPNNQDVIIPKLDLRDIKEFHHPAGCAASSMAVKRRTETSASISINYTGDNLPDYAGAYIDLDNENWEALHANGRLTFDINCEGDFAYQTIVLELKSVTRAGNVEVIRPYEIDLMRKTMSFDIHLKQFSEDCSKFAFMRELVFLFNSGIFKGNAAVEISNLKIMND